MDITLLILDEHAQQRNLFAQIDSIDPADTEALGARVCEQYETQGSPYYSTARIWDDGVIDPADTRTVLGLALSAVSHAPLEEVGYGVFRM